MGYRKTDGCDKHQVGETWRQEEHAHAIESSSLRHYEINYCRGHRGVTMAILISTPLAAETPPSRDGPVVTQTITRSHTTITAIVTLGGGPTLTPTPETTTTSASPTATVPISVTPQSTVLTGAQIGAIAGSVGGFVLLVLLLWYCISTSRLRGGGRTVSSSGDGSSSEDEGMGYDPWARRRPMPPQPPPTGLRRGAPPLVPPPTRIPPTPRYTPYRQTRHAQFRGVTRYP